MLLGHNPVGLRPTGCNPALPDSYQETDTDYPMTTVRWAQGLPWALNDKELAAHF
jgi:hypothetical protein